MKNGPRGLLSIPGLRHLDLSFYCTRLRGKDFATFNKFCSLSDSYYLQWESIVVHVHIHLIVLASRIGQYA